MVVLPFIDSNILLYAGSKAPEDAFKRQVASPLIASLHFCLSSQVIQEYISNALKKKALGISADQIEVVLRCLADVTVQPVTYEVIVQAWLLRRRYQLSHWDSTIIAAAQALGCTTLYSEDLTHGQDFDGLRVINPFL